MKFTSKTLVEHALSNCIHESYFEKDDTMSNIENWKLISKYSEKFSKYKPKVVFENHSLIKDDSLINIREFSGPQNFTITIVTNNSDTEILSEYGDQHLDPFEASILQKALDIMNKTSVFDSSDIKDYIMSSLHPIENFTYAEEDIPKLLQHFNQCFDVNLSLSDVKMADDILYNHLFDIKNWEAEDSCNEIYSVEEICDLNGDADVCYEANIPNHITSIKTRDFITSKGVIGSYHYSPFEFFRLTVVTDEDDKFILKIYCTND